MQVRELVAQVLALHCTSTAEELLEMWKKEGQVSRVLRNLANLCKVVNGNSNNMGFAFLKIK